MIKFSFLRAMMVASGLILSFVAITPANAEVRLNITKGNVQPLPIAITDFMSGDGIGAQVSAVVAADLQRSGLFAPINKSAFIEKISNPDQSRALKTGRSSMPRHW